MRSARSRAGTRPGASVPAQKLKKSARRRLGSRFHSDEPREQLEDRHAGRAGVVAAGGGAVGRRACRRGRAGRTSRRSSRRRRGRRRRRRRRAPARGRGARTGPGRGSRRGRRRVRAARRGGAVRRCRSPVRRRARASWTRVVPTPPLAPCTRIGLPGPDPGLAVQHLPGGDAVDDERLGLGRGRRRRGPPRGRAASTSDVAGPAAGLGDRRHPGPTSAGSTPAPTAVHDGRPGRSRARTGTSAGRGSGRGASAARRTRRRWPPPRRAPGRRRGRASRRWLTTRPSGSTTPGSTTSVRWTVGSDDASRGMAMPFSAVVAWSWLGGDRC